MTSWPRICSLALLVCGISIADLQAARPNILLAISDDHSFPHTGAYGDRGVRTPAFDQIARRGVLFRNAFAASPGCSPSRAALLTGRNTWELEHAGTHASTFSDKFAVYPDLLEQAGYFVGYTGKGWGPGNFRDGGRTRNPAGPSFQRHKRRVRPGVSSTNYSANFADFLEQRPDESPFCFWFGCHEPHRSYAGGSGRAAGKTLASASVPAFLPDTPEIRSDILDYYLEIEWFDQHLAQMIHQLQQRNLLENTLVIVTGDNGMPFPRAKANCYEFGIHVPLAVQWPDGVPGGRVVNDLIGFTDIAPTLLAAAGLPVQRSMTGRSFLDVLQSPNQGLVDASRTAVFSARERHSSSRHQNWTYPIRAMRTQRYLYIRNFRPQRWPAGHPAGFGKDRFGYYDIDGCPTKTWLIDHRGAAGGRIFFELPGGRRPAEELYAVDDPGNLRNLINDADHAESLSRLRDRFTQYLKQTGDPRILDGGDVYETYKRYSRIRSFPPPTADEPQ